LDPGRATKSGWPVVLTVIFSLVFGAGVMMTFLAIAFEQFFISQLVEARKLSQ
jgi:high-affinity Fe2+/Pb2+ permease